jgi:hypothetical protein
MGRNEKINLADMKKRSFINILKSVLFKFWIMKQMTAGLFVVLAIVLYSCNEIKLEQPENLDYFMKFYGNFHNDQLSDVAVSGSENIILTGYREVVEEKDEAWIIKTGKGGMVEWEKTLSGTNNFRGYGLFVDETIYYVGYEQTLEATSQRGFLYQYSMAGRLIDSISFNIEAETVKDMKFLNEGTNIRFIAHVNKNSQDEVLIYEINQRNAVNLVSANRLFKVVEDRLYFYERDNGNIYFSGSINQSGADGNTDILVSCLESDNFIWSYVYGEEDISEKAAGIVYMDDFLFLGGTKMKTNKATGSTYILKLDNTGQEIGQNGVGQGDNSVVYDFKLHNDNEFVFTGKKVIDSKNSKIFLVRTSLRGAVKVEKDYGEKGLSEGRYIRNLPGGRGFVIAGNVSTSGVNTEAKDVLVIKVNEEGEWID